MNTTILTWDGTDHEAIYEKQLEDNPLYYDTNLKLWVAYNYEYCKALLQHPDAQIPQPVTGEDSLLNGKAKLLLHKMARISNDGQHEASRAASMMIYHRINRVPLDQVLRVLLKETRPSEFDWVEVICKQLPVRLILTGLGFNQEDCNYINANLASLVLVMSPAKTDMVIETLNAIVNRIWEIAERYTIGLDPLADGETRDLLICNLIGLIIQCYDAGRGLLCNALINQVHYDIGHRINKDDNSFYKKLVEETLRLDPPVHNTRRIAVKNIALGGHIIKAGETIMIALAAANLDPKIFKEPHVFDIDRINNDLHLTFGLGGHACLAKYFCIDMAADTCRFLADNYQNISIKQKELTYELQLNVRLVKQLMISLS